MCPPRLLHAVRDALGVMVVVLVNVARIVMVLVVDVYANVTFVLVGVGRANEEAI